MIVREARPAIATCDWAYAAAVWLLIAASAGAITLPDCFDSLVIADGFVQPMAIAFAPGERIFVAEKNGRVWIVDNGVRLPLPFIDLIDEVGNAHDRGMLGLALAPDFTTDPWVYLLYVVDPVPGQPDESGTTPSFGRLVRYLADPLTGGDTALLSSRQVLIGELPADGFIHCYSSHAVGTVLFAPDGSLIVGTGDGASFTQTDAGGLHPACFVPPLFDPLHDVGAFRAQHLGSLAGKILRIDPSTGEGLSDNPFWTGDAAEVQSKVWVYGLRNPFRFSLRPGSGVPGTLYIGDVGWRDWEEVEVAHGGENFGWPCYEGTVVQASYFSAQPAHSDCTTLETPANPGPVTPPLITWHHSGAGSSIPPGYKGRCAIGGSFYTGTSYPPEYQGRYFFADFVNDWIMVLEVDQADQFVSLTSFAGEAAKPVAFQTHPTTGDLHYVSLATGEIRRITYTQPVPADADRDCDVDLVDYRGLQGCFTGEGGQAVGPCLSFDSDLDGDVDLTDFAAFQVALTGP